MKFLQQHALLVAGAVIGIYSWRAASGGVRTPSAGAGALLPELDATDLRGRNDLEAVSELDDPFRMARLFTEIASEREAAPSESGANRAPPAPGTETEPERAVGPLLEKPADADSAAAEPPLEPFPLGPIHRPTLRLNATLDSAEEALSMARLNGRNVRVGEVVPGLDPSAPPLLLEVAGTSATVSYRDVVYTVDLVHLPAVVLGGDPTEAPPPTEKVEKEL